MKKKTRININTSLKVYIKVLLSFIFNKGHENENILNLVFKLNSIFENIISHFYPSVIELFFN